MARKRDLKPSFFKNEDLADLHPLTRLMFQAMWCVADRNGRLEDRPRRIKIECLPYDDHSIEDALAELAAGSFIDRYEVDGVALLEITNFTKHQNPHPNEPAVYPENPHGYQEQLQEIASNVMQPPRARESVLGVSGKGLEELQPLLDELERHWPVPRCRGTDRQLRESAIFDQRESLPVDLVEDARLFIAASGFTDSVLAGCPNLHRWIAERRWLDPLPKRKGKPTPTRRKTEADYKAGWEQIRRENREKDAQNDHHTKGKAA